MIELNRIYNEDCLEGMKRIDDKSIDLTVTSPPYDNLRTYNGYSFDFENIAKELYRVTKDGGVVVWVVGDKTDKGSETLTSFKQALYFKEIGFNVHDTMIYQKNMLTFPDKTRYYQCFEYMFVLSKGKPKTINLIKDRKNSQAGANVSGGFRDIDGSIKQKSGNRKGNTIKEYGVRFNVWKYEVGYMKTTKDKFAYEHPAMFPEQLANDHILTWSSEGEIVLDPFCGAGTTLKMALLNKRRFIGFELSAEYVTIANRRIQQEAA